MENIYRLQTNYKSLCLTPLIRTNGPAIQPSRSILDCSSSKKQRPLWR